jgi:hypothetical protein
MFHLRYLAAPLVISALVVQVTVGSPVWGVGDTSAHDPAIEFVTPTDGSTVGGELPYGSIQVKAWDADIGEDNGDGIRFVTLTIIDDDTAVNHNSAVNNGRDRPALEFKPRWTC